MGVTKDEGNDGGNGGETLQIVFVRQLFQQIVVADNILQILFQSFFLQIDPEDNFFWQLVNVDHRFTNIRYRQFFQNYANLVNCHSG